ncbi:hypothetical protein ACIHAA_05370 [Streptomyces sp. NPDC052040]|uniref:DUF6841 family protein n=1 Tax=Streptomyces sp. NPDC052040 TaxID=3365682 RepID=UPI0037D63D7A
MSVDRLAATRTEVTHWFFEDYLPRWAAVAAGESTEGPEFILAYWGTPLHVTAFEQSFWCLDDASVLRFLELNHAPLRESGYSHTVVPDRRVIVYNAVGASIEVIWSRRRADESEVQRWAVHFSVAKSERGWRVVAIHATETNADVDHDSLAEVWSHDAAARAESRG